MLNELERREVQTGFGWGKLKKKRHLGRPSYGWEDDIKSYLKQIGWRAWEN
jgi:hypothetical protein